MRRWRSLAVVTLSLVLAFILTAGPAGRAQAAPQFPALTGRVVDQAHVLSPQVQAQLTDQLAGLEAKTSRQLVVVTIPSLDGYDIADYGYQLGRAWGVGQKGLNNGVLLIVAPSEHKVRIEVGYGLEPIITDAFSNLVLQRQVLPKFRAGDIEGGVVDGTQALVQQLSLDSSAAEAKAAAASAQAGQTSSRSGSSPIAVVIFIFVLLLAMRGILGGRGGGLGWFLSGLFLGGMGGGGGRNDGFGGGGGGFSGGGGSFGGGGSSGSW